MGVLCHGDLMVRVRVEGLGLRVEVQGLCVAVLPT